MASSGLARRVQLVADQLERLVPVDRRRSGVAPGRLTIGWVIRPCWPSQYSDCRSRSAMLCAAKNSGVARARGGLLGDRLGAVLAELGGVPVPDLRVGPGAAHAVEALGLVQLQQRLRGAFGAHVAQRPLHRHRDGRRAGRVVLRMLDRQVGLGVAAPVGAACHRLVLRTSAQGLGLTPADEPGHDAGRSGTRPRR